MPEPEPFGRQLDDRHSLQIRISFEPLKFVDLGVKEEEAGNIIVLHPCASILLYRSYLLESISSLAHCPIASLLSHFKNFISCRLLWGIRWYTISSPIQNISAFLKQLGKAIQLKKLTAKSKTGNRLTKKCPLYIFLESNRSKIKPRLTRRHLSAHLGPTPSITSG